MLLAKVNPVENKLQELLRLATGKDVRILEHTICRLPLDFWTLVHNIGYCYLCGEDLTHSTTGFRLATAKLPYEVSRHIQLCTDIDGCESRVIIKLLKKSVE